MTSWELSPQLIQWSQAVGICTAAWACFKLLWWLFGKLFPEKDKPHKVVLEKGYAGKEGRMDMRIQNIMHVDPRTARIQRTATGVVLHEPKPREQAKGLQEFQDIIRRSKQRQGLLPGGEPGGSFYVDPRFTPPMKGPRSR